MKPKLHKHLAAAILAVGFLGSTVGLPVVVVACPVMQKWSVKSSCCEEQSDQQSTNLSASASYTCCLRTVLASSLRLESTELKSTNFVQQERAGLSSPLEAVSSSTLTQNPSLTVPVVAGFSPPRNSYQVTLPLRI